MSYGGSRRSKKRMESDDSGDDWMISYSDVVTLLFAFLAIVLSVCKIDPVKAERVMTNIQEFSSQHEVEGTMQRVEREVTQALADNGFTSEADVRTTERGIEVDLRNGILFEPGSAKLSKKASAALKAVVAPVLHLPVGIEIEGHTDSAPIRSKIYPSNWELSGARASVVVRNLMKLGFEGNRLKAIGLADTRPPLVDKTKLTAQEIMAAQRRVTLVLIPKIVQVGQKNSQLASQASKKKGPAAAKAAPAAVKGKKATKAAPKKSTGKKSVGKKAPAKKSTGKKSASKKSTGKKSTSKKSTGKKSSGKLSKAKTTKKPYTGKKVKKPSKGKKAQGK